MSRAGAATTGAMPAKRTRTPAARADADAFVAACGHPLTAELDALRAIVRKAAPGAVEGIKWNAPSYAVDGDDRLTFQLAAKDRIRLVFHTGAKDRSTHTGRRVLADDGGLLEWAADNRAIATFRSMADVRAARVALAKLVRAWLAAT